MMVMEGKVRTSHHCPHTRNHFYRPRLDAGSIVCCAECWIGLLGAAPSDCSVFHHSTAQVSTFLAGSTILGSKESRLERVEPGGRTSSQETVFGEDGDGVDDEDGDCLRVSAWDLVR